MAQILARGGVMTVGAVALALGAVTLVAISSSTLPTRRRVLAPLTAVQLVSRLEK